jgi:hypothetical protein
MRKVLTKADIYNRVARLRADPNRLISAVMLSELAGISIDTFKNVFVSRETPMSETTQIRMSRALERFEAGEVEVMFGRDKKHFIQIHQKPKPKLKRGYGLTVEGGEIKLKIGIRNRADYSEPTFKELMTGD